MLDVVIVSSEKVIFEGQANSVILPGEQGVFELLTYHKPLLSRLIKGRIVIDEKIFPIRRGLIGVNLNKASIIIEE